MHYTGTSRIIEATLSPIASFEKEAGSSSKDMKANHSNCLT